MNETCCSCKKKIKPGDFFFMITRGVVFGKDSLESIDKIRNEPFDPLHVHESCFLPILKTIKNGNRPKTADLFKMKVKK